jgi:DUF2075 family protein/DNA replication protein DnaC
VGLIKTFEYHRADFEKIGCYRYGKNWPVVYVLEGQKEAYVGETINAYKRSQQHYKIEERKKLDQIHIISDDDFNKSAALDIESMLIQYMAADNKYKLQNSNVGLTNHNYYDKELYLAKFEKIWEQLRRKNVVVKGIFEIRNSDLFKYSPYKALNSEQVAVVEAIRESIIEETESKHIIQGEPGTGKTIVAIYLVKYLTECEQTKHLNIGLVVPMTSLRGTLKKVFRSVKGLKSNMILSPFDVTKEKYDILIVDEAHRLNRRVNISNMGQFNKMNRSLDLDIKEGDQLDWIRQAAKHIVLCYDPNQSVRPSDILPHKIDKLNALKYSIKSQMRVLGGQDYIEYVHNILHRQQEEVKSFDKYDFYLFEDIVEMEQQVKIKQSKYGLCRMVAGYAWPWKSKKDMNLYDIEIQGRWYRWNSTNQDWVNSDKALEEIGCIHTIQGYDLNYVGVIIGDEIAYRNGQIEICVEKYFDKYGKQAVASVEILKAYILNIYKTLLTRGIRGTYVYICDDALREYLKQFIPIYRREVINYLAEEQQIGHVSEGEEHYEV